MSIPIVYNVRSLRQRPVSTLATAFGMALVVAVFIAMSALANGFRLALVATGSADNVLVLRKGADSEMSSGLGRDAVNIIAAMPFVAQAGGRPLVSPESFVVINLERLTGGLANVVARGVEPIALEVRRGVRVTAGRMFTPGTAEIVVGKNIIHRFSNLGVGDRITFANREWTVAGHFEAGGSSFESEIWGENEQFIPAFRGGGTFQSVTLRMADPDAFEEIERVLEGDHRLGVDAYREVTFYANQSVLLHRILSFIAVFVAGIMAVGAVFGAVNTMYAAVAQRGPEIAVLRTLGFPPFSVLTSFVIEAVGIALLGGLLGCLIVLPVNGIVTSTTNWSSFSEVAFAFRITPPLLVSGLVFAVVMGVAGGFFPAWRAARQPVVEALRAG